MEIAHCLAPDRVGFLGAADKAGALDELCRLMSRSPHICDHRAFRLAILKREEALSTGIGLGLAVPHAKIESVTDFVLAAGVHHKGIDFDSLDKKPVHILVMVATPIDQQREYLTLLARITALLKEERVRGDILASPDPAGVHRILTNKR